MVTVALQGKSSRAEVCIKTSITDMVSGILDFLCNNKDQFLVVNLKGF
jgi:hypothetical protein